MIFEAELRRARQKLKSIEEKLERLTASRTRIADLLQEYTGYREQFERGLALAWAAGAAQCVPVYQRLPYPPHHEVVGDALIAAGEHDRIERERQSWGRVLERLKKIQDRIERRLEDLEERKLRLEFWILEKEETWGKVDPHLLKEQMRQIVLAAEELSQLLVGRKVAISFDTSDRAPLGYVPIHKERGSLRMVYLSTALLAEQPEHLLDHYRALIVHELGHLLLHLKDSAREYRQLRRLLREKVSLAPGFFDVFNILLDEQLERLLRDTRPEWQRWFNRLDFYTRRIPLWDLRQLLSRSGRADPEAAVHDLVARRLIKVYDDPECPFATIQSAALFGEVPQITRLYAFYAVLRHRLPLATVPDGWLRQCLDCIPRTFKSLDVFGVHALAVEIYRILMAGEFGFQLVKLWVRRGGSDEPVEIEVPGTWLPVRVDAAGKIHLPDWSADVGKVHDLSRGRRRRGRTLGSRLEELDGGTEPPRRPPAPADSGEGEPPPPPPSPPPPPPRPSVRQRKVRRPDPPSSTSIGGYGGYAGYGSSASSAGLPGWGSPAPGYTSRKQRKASARKAAQARNPRRRARQQRAASRKQAAQNKQSSQQPRQETPREKRPPLRPPQPSREPPPQPPPNLLPSDASARDIENAERLAAEQASSWSPASLMKGVKRALDQILKEVREELAGKRGEVPSLDRMTPDGGRPSDQKNAAEVREFPAPE